MTRTYPDSYNADEQHNIGGVFDGNLTYDRSNMVWVNGLYMEYAKSKTTEDGVTTENENQDQILLLRTTRIKSGSWSRALSARLRTWAMKPSSQPLI